MNLLKLFIYFVVLGVLIWFFHKFGFSPDTVVKYIQYGICGTFIILIIDELGKS